MIQNLYNLADMAAKYEIMDSRAFSDFCGVESESTGVNGDGSFRLLFPMEGVEENRPRVFSRQFSRVFAPICFSAFLRSYIMLSARSNTSPSRRSWGVRTA